MQSTQLDCFLYHSELAANADISCVADIVKKARSFNSSVGITGMLIFDGQRFCQYIEGPIDQLNTLIDKIAKDPRHINFTLQMQCTSGKGRRFQNWSMAYVLLDDSEPLEEMGKLRGQNALDNLNTLIPLLDSQ